MFSGIGSAFNSDLSKWQTDRVTDMEGRTYIKSRIQLFYLLHFILFTYADKRNFFFYTIYIHKNYGVTLFVLTVFYEATAFNGDLSKWQTSAVTNMYNLFGRAHAFNGDLSKWQTDKVTTMQDMFQRANVFNGDLSKWQTGRVTNMHASK